MFQNRKILFSYLLNFVNQLPRNVEHEKKGQFKRFLSTAEGNEFEKLHMNTFSQWMKLYCRYKDIIINPLQQNDRQQGRNKKNGVDYIELSTAHQTPVPSEEPVLDEQKSF